TQYLEDDETKEAEKYKKEKIINEHEELRGSMVSVFHLHLHLPLLLFHLLVVDGLNLRHFRRLEFRREISMKLLRVSEIALQSAVDSSLLKMSVDDHRRWRTAGPISGDEEGEGRFESSVNAVPFCLVATAVLISIFLLLALFERFMFIRTTQSAPFDTKNPPFASPKV
ncbi:hypothetical protein EUTSA_v10026992mg, partial [Eutrema salsugineum]